jgi:hypothetical protein
MLHCFGAFLKQLILKRNFFMKRAEGSEINHFAACNAPHSAQNPCCAVQQGFDGCSGNPL